MEVGDPWAPPPDRAPAPPPPPPPPPPAAPAPPPPPPPSPAPAPVPVLPGGPRPDGGIVPSPFGGDGPTLPTRANEEPAETDRRVATSVTRAALGPSRSHRRLGPRGRLTTAATFLSMMTTIAAAIALLQRRAGWIEVRDGGAITTERLGELDDLVVLLAFTDLGVFTVAGIVGMLWFWRAYRNLKTMGRNTRTAGWAFWGWIVPIISLFRPYQLAKELVRESPRHRGHEGTGVVGIWWLALLSAQGGGQFLAFMPQDTADDIILNDMLRVAVRGVTVIAGVAWIALVRVVTTRQDAWFDPEPDAEPLHIGPHGAAPPATR